MKHELAQQVDELGMHYGSRSRRATNVEICTKLNQYAGNEPEVPVPAKVNHHVYRSVPPRMERLSFHKGGFR